MSDIWINIPYDELSIGQSASLTRTVREADITLFAAASHDTNPAHMDADYAAGTPFKKVIIHGMWTAGLISAVIGTRLPGVGSIYLGQDLQFRRPVYVGDTVTATLTVTEKDDKRKWVKINTIVTNQRGEKVVVGVANVMPPREKISREVIPVPEVSIK
ncbi:MaoC/PaaZ C-terminal domain-containing protein [Snodgrassella sp. CFCC 13594]|uniref:MaoC/PaaZ C-terminal domain-containing protein n=1 Tax=Snodgrassella sp. CFCC 13594 TaxID=1775559 RepID=UPI000834FD38|nr:MaoC/PaaZ C-terminal domain-containing protein [Snodgrassella sp. CFCC 13594]